MEGIGRLARGDAIADLHERLGRIFQLFRQPIRCHIGGCQNKAIARHEAFFTGVVVDDGRAVAALKALADLSQRTQVLFFTHHRHLIDLAQKHLPSDVLFVHELPSR